MVPFVSIASTVCVRYRKHEKFLITFRVKVRTSLKQGQTRGNGLQELVCYTHAESGSQVLFTIHGIASVDD